MSNILRRVNKSQAAQCANRARAFRLQAMELAQQFSGTEVSACAENSALKALDGTLLRVYKTPENKKDYVYFVLNKQDLRLAKIAIALLSERHQRRKQATTLYSLLEGLDQASAHSDGLICDIKQ
jgi:hypothetical protein